DRGVAPFELPHGAGAETPQFDLALIDPADRVTTDPERPGPTLVEPRCLAARPGHADPAVVTLACGRECRCAQYHRERAVGREMRRLEQGDLEGSGRNADLPGCRGSADVERGVVAAPAECLDS